MNFEGFEWDSGNKEKNLIKHNVTRDEAEEVFYSKVKYRRANDSRYFLFGQTAAGRRLFVVFELKSTLVRVISARDMTQKERRYYDQK
ncbi:MAG: BrnT family toxin [Actinomycetota bacterium]|nr:BrnT family toxin [Actinomycetota bacterium]